MVVVGQLLWLIFSYATSYHQFMSALLLDMGMDLGNISNASASAVSPQLASQTAGESFSNISSFYGVVLFLLQVVAVS